MSDLDRLLFVMQVKEAAASVSLSHAEGCRCLVCRAAGGDEDAMAEVLMVVNPPASEDAAHG